MDDKQIKEAKDFMAALAHAQVNGLGLEFMTTFLQEIRHGDSVPQAIMCAFREWDL